MALMSLVLATTRFSLIKIRLPTGMSCFSASSSSKAELTYQEQDGHVGWIPDIFVQTSCFLSTLLAEYEYLPSWCFTGSETGHEPLP